MKISTLELLKKLQKRYGVRGKPSGSFGKIMQKLLALAFSELGYRNIVERGTQGVDIDITSGQTKFAVEAKVTEGTSIVISSDNIQALKERGYDGYEPLIVVLQLAPLENWECARLAADEIPTGEILIESLRRWRIKDLETKLSAVFDGVVEKHFSGVEQDGEQYLKKQLRQAGITSKE